MIQFQKPKKVDHWMEEIWGRGRTFKLYCFLLVTFMVQIYNDRRLFFAGGPGVVPNDNFGPVAPSGPNADRRSSRGRGMFFIPDI